MEILLNQKNLVNKKGEREISFMHNAFERFINVRYKIKTEIRNASEL